MAPGRFPLAKNDALYGCFQLKLPNDVSAKLSQFNKICYKIKKGCSCASKNVLVANRKEQKHNSLLFRSGDFEPFLGWQIFMTGRRDEDCRNRFRCGR